MKRLACLFGAVLSCLLLSTCGTGRAIVGDYADDYVIRNIRPLSAVSGEDAIFEADICYTDGAIVDQEGNAPKYTWDFGGGAEPNISFEPSPRVTIRDGIRAPYQCTLTARGGCLDDQEVTATFTLNVAGLDVIAVTPLSGTGGGSALFSVVVGSGNVTSYAWDFGGACNPNGSNLTHPNVAFTPIAGVYNARVIITNSFEAYEYPFTITVLPGPPEPEE